jgi:hypothetical protein
MLTKYAKMNEFIILINEAVELIVLSGKGSVCRLRINGRKSRTIFLSLYLSTQSTIYGSVLRFCPRNKLRLTLALACGDGSNSEHCRHNCHYRRGGVRASTAAISMSLIRRSGFFYEKYTTSARQVCYFMSKMSRAGQE